MCLGGIDREGGREKGGREGERKEGGREGKGRGVPGGGERRKEGGENRRMRWSGSPGIRPPFLVFFKLIFIGV